LNWTGGVVAIDYPKIVTELPGPKAAALIARDAAAVSPSYTRDYPLVAARGVGCMIEDPDGNRFLDCTAGIAVTATGHCHPKVVAAIKAQADRLVHMSGTDFYYEPQIELAERVGKHFPGNGPKRVFFCNSGTEAIEAAIKLARYVTGRKQIIGFFGAFHGRTLGALSVTGSKYVQRERYFPLVPGVTHIPYPDPYRTPRGLTPEQHASECVAWLRDKIFQTIVPPSEVAAVLVEAIQGEGGYVIPPANFLPELKALCEVHGILLMCDEVQSGVGRTGKFFAFEHAGIVPDVVAVAKGIASGLPLGLIITPAELMQWKPGAHASTFGGNPIACAAALATLDLVEQELMANATVQGAYLKLQLQELAGRHALIGDVRGLGLMIAVELVRDRVTKERADTERNAIIQAAFQRGLLLLGCGANNIRFCPALTITREEIDVTVRLFDAALTAVARGA